MMDSREPGPAFDDRTGTGLTLVTMRPLKAHVKDGRIVLDEPVIGVDRNPNVVSTRAVTSRADGVSLPLGRCARPRRRVEGLVPVPASTWIAAVSRVKHSIVVNDY